MKNTEKVRKNTESQEKYSEKLGKILVRPKKKEKKKVLTQIWGKSQEKY